MSQDSNASEQRTYAPSQEFAAQANATAELYQQAEDQG